MTDPQKFTRELGGKWMKSYGTAPCPVCQSERRKDQNALTITAKRKKLLLNCKKSNCDFRDILDAARVDIKSFETDPVAVLELERAQAEQAARSLNRARSAWNVGQPITHTLGEAYLRARGIMCDLPDSLRWVPDVYHTPSGRLCAAMVASVQPTGGVHRTFFTKQGERLTQSAKMMLGPCGGGAVRLSLAPGPLLVCEGIETGLSLLSGLLSSPATVWAALSTSGMRGLHLPPAPGKLIVATDGDTPGREAGSVLANRARAHGWQVGLMPAPDGQDWNDVLQSRISESSV